MTIVDKPFAAELVSKKGKVFKFDAIECMVQYLDPKSDDEFAHFLVRDLNVPDDWQDARQCTYLISDQLPSPMGAFLSAYSTREAAGQMQQSKGGEVFTWQQLRQKIKQ
jgi:copper chaperone NosL